MTDSPSDDISRQLKIYVRVFIGLLAGTLLTVTLYYLHFADVAVSIAIALFVAAVKAFLVAGFFMHLMSERKVIYVILAATALFVGSLMYLTVYARSDTPHGTEFHGAASIIEAGTVQPSE